MQGEEELLQMTDDTEALRHMLNYMSPLVPFSLGLFISVCLGRWWAMRATYLQNLMFSIRSLSFLLRATMPAEAAWLRKRVERIAMLGHRLVYFCAQGRQRPESLVELHLQGFMTDDEYHCLSARMEKLPVS